MTEFMMIFRLADRPAQQMSAEEIQANIKLWRDWIGAIAAQGKFVSTAQLGPQGKTLKPGNVITDGPYAEVKEIIGGNLVVKAASIDEAVRLAQGCPILQAGGHVEVRDLIRMD